jgi:hypothetical protein
MDKPCSNLRLRGTNAKSSWKSQQTSLSIKVNSPPGNRLARGTRVNSLPGNRLARGTRVNSLPGNRLARGTSLNLSIKVNSSPGNRLARGTRVNSLPGNRLARGTSTTIKASGHRSRYKSKGTATATGGRNKSVVEQRGAIEQLAKSGCVTQGELRGQLAHIPQAETFCRLLLLQPWAMAVAAWDPGPWPCFCRLLEPETPAQATCPGKFLRGTGMGMPNGQPMSLEN